MLQEALLFVVVYGSKDGQPKGTIFFKAARPDMLHHRCSELRIVFKPRREYPRPIAYVPQAIEWALEWAFKTAGLHRVEVNLMECNKKAILLYEEMGFREEGRRRECFFVDGQWHDEICMGILKTEWADKYEA